MPVEVRAQGVACNLGCSYCYQNPLRDAGNINTKYDVDSLIQKLEEEGQEFHLFGGEPLLMPKPDLERMFQYGLEKHKKNGLQSNGVLIDDDHIEMFKKYNVAVGISIDGPEELNDLRIFKNREETRKATNKTISNIEKMVFEGIPVAVIITLHKLNGTKEKLPKLIDFISYLGDIGVSNGNIHLLEVDSALVQQFYALTEEENAEAFLTLAKFFDENHHLTYRPFIDMERLMNFNDENTLCFLKFCDPLNTLSVRGLEGDGSISNCNRTNKEGIDFYKAEDSGLHRYISLYNTPDELGGCQGCRFFTVCGGSCPGEAIDGDWRNKTIHCHTMKSLFTHYEEKIEEAGGVPLTKREDFDLIESMIINGLHLNKIIGFKEVASRLQNRNDSGVPRNAIVVPVKESESDATT